MHRGKNVGQHVDRIARRAAEQPGMQVPVGAGEPDLFVHQATQRGRDRGRLCVPHAGIAHESEVAFELCGMLAHEAEQVFRTALLFAFDHHGNVERELAGDRLEGAASLDKGHGLAFVVASAAGDDDFSSAVEGLDARLERRRLPQIERIDRLHIVMAVEQHARRLAVSLIIGFAVAALTSRRLADDDRMSFRRTHARFQAEAAQIRRDVFRRSAAVRRKCRIG